MLEPPPERCRAAVFVGPGRPLELREFDVPDPEPGEALVRVTCCTLCGSDVHTVTGARTEPTPSILGHEIIGTVAELPGEPLCDVDGTPLRIGDRVTWSTVVSCGHCDRCRRGLPQKCRSLTKYGHAVAEGRTALSGGLSEYVLLQRGSAVMRLDAALPAEIVGPANCATATVAAAFRAAESVTGRAVLILGAGMLGLTAAAFARVDGAETVVVTDVDSQRLALGDRFGATHTVVADADPDRFSERLRKVCGREAFDVVLEMSGAASAVEAAVLAGDVGACIVLVGSVKDSRPVAIDPQRVVRRWLAIRGVHNYASEDLRTAVAFLTEHGRRFPFADLVAETFALADVNRAFETVLRDRPIRVAVRPGGEPT